MQKLEVFSEVEKMHIKRILASSYAYSMSAEKATGFTSPSTYRYSAGYTLFNFYRGPHRLLRSQAFDMAG